MENMRLIPIGPDGKPAEAVSFNEITRSICDAMVALHKKTGFSPPWIGYLAERDGRLIGTCGFKSAPQNGRVEIAYFTFPEGEGRGIATAMASELVRIAREFDPEVICFAQTLPETNASNSILQKLGFRFVGAVNHPEDGDVWEWELSKDAESAVL